MRGVPAGFRAFVLPFEGEKLYPYDDVAGLPTIYIGHLIKVGEIYTHTEEDSAHYLAQDALAAFNAVEEFTNGTTNDNEYMALGSFAFNVGIGALKSSTLLRKYLAGDRVGAAEQFLVWDKVHENGQLVVCEPIEKRRIAERALFLTPVQ